MNPAIFRSVTHPILAPNRLALPSFICPSVVAQSYHSPRGARPIFTMTDASSCTDISDHAMGTRYHLTSTEEGRRKKWICISFDALGDAQPTKKELPSDEILPRQAKDVIPGEKSGDDNTTSKSHSHEQSLPDSVLQYQRQMRKIQAADRASKTNVNIKEHLHTVYFDDHIVVTNKPSGILCVPGVNKHRSLLDLVFEVYGNAGGDDDQSSPLPRDSMIAHRLDMDTSGIIIFARTRSAMSKLHKSFREKTGTKKVYEALLVGRLDVDKWIENANSVEHARECELPDGVDSGGGGLGGGEIRLPLQRDHRHPPFMRVATPESEAAARRAVRDLNRAGYRKLVAKRPKPSVTRFRVLSHEEWGRGGHPVTRVALTPVTGRTHQLRVHCAAIGHPILGDPAYGFCGEAHPNGGFGDALAAAMSPTAASFALRRDAEEAVRKAGRTMCLHAKSLTLDHPSTGENVSFEAAPPF